MEAFSATRVYTPSCFPETPQYCETLPKPGEVTPVETNPNSVSVISALADALQESRRLTAQGRALKQRCPEVQERARRTMHAASAQSRSVILFHRSDLASSMNLHSGRRTHSSNNIVPFRFQDTVPEQTRGRRDV